MKDVGTSTILTEKDRCSSCKQIHPESRKPWMCQNDDCGAVVCRTFALDGRQWNRNGKRVHILRHIDKVTNKWTRKLVLCGELVQVDDAEPAAAPQDSIAPGNFSETTEPAAPATSTED